ncbi:MAG TPA: hypothetical protein VGI40_14795 [Pirellulaceae bacterium]|jgi:hypothetical protein
MPTVSHRGYRIAVEHPAVWVDRGERIIRDLVEVMMNRQITDECLRHLIASRERLVAGHYELPDDGGCLMFVLTKPLGEAQIRTKHDLIRFFGRPRGFPGWPGYVAAKDSPEYQPAKWLVRLIDGQFCEQVRSRYGRACELFDYDLVIAAARQILAQRCGASTPARGELQMAGS